MQQNPTIKQQKPRSPSDSSLLNLNLKQKFRPLSEILKSPISQRKMIKNATPSRSPSTSHYQHSLPSKHNPEAGSQFILKFSFRGSSKFKDVPLFKSNGIKASNLKLFKDAFVNELVQPPAVEKRQGWMGQNLKVSDFKKLRELGRGKFGVVWMARHKKTNFVCALKIINKKVAKQQKVEYQVAKEIRIHNMLKHHNIIAFYGFFSDQLNLYIVTEFATDGHVYDKLKKQHRLEEAEVRDLTRQTADGLRNIHNMGYAHRDIKPENILLQFGIVKICDFGWAAQCQGYQMRKSQCGTPLYYSPEVVKKESHDERVDVWSLGLLAYELIVGRVPFRIWSEFDLPVILKQEVVVPDYVDSSQHLKDFVLRCLAKDQKYRPLLFELRQHQFLNQGLLKIQNIQGIYEELQALF